MVSIDQLILNRSLFQCCYDGVGCFYIFILLFLNIFNKLNLNHRSYSTWLDIQLQIQDVFAQTLILWLIIDSMALQTWKYKEINQNTLNQDLLNNTTTHSGSYCHCNVKKENLDWSTFFSKLSPSKCEIDILWLALVFSLGQK